MKMKWLVPAGVIAAFLLVSALVAQMVPIPGTGSPALPLITSSNPSLGNPCTNYNSPVLNWLTGELWGCANGSTVRIGFPEVAKADLTAQSATIANAVLYSVPANAAGPYRATCYIVITQAATTSSTLPNCWINWNDNDSGVVESNAVTSTSTANAAGTTGYTSTLLGTIYINAKAGTNVLYSAAGYVSSGATPMQYAAHLRLEYLGQ